MLHRVLLPQLGQTMDEGTIERWHKREGDRVQKGEVLYELTTDKATLEVEAFADGVLKKILVDEGRTVPVNDLIAIIGDEEDELPEDLRAFRAEAAAPGPGEEATSASTAAGPAVVEREAPAPGRVLASPRARKVAEEMHVPLEALAGSGPGGRIVERDVRAYLADLEGIRFTPAAARLAREAGVDLRRVAQRAGDRRVRKEDVLAAIESGLAGRPLPAPGERVPFTPMRRTIAERMTASKQTVPHFYLVGQVNMGAAMRLREEMAEAGHEKATVTALLVKAVALALRGHPRVNARLDGDAVVLNRESNVGVAVAVEDGLFVPVVRNADAKDLVAISAELKSLAETARAGKLIPEQYEGGSITISNLGTYGVDYFLPIINPPEACIIGVGAIADRVIPRDGSFFVEPIMQVSLSADHRIVNGAEAAEFFQTLRALLEEPSRLGA